MDDSSNPGPILPPDIPRTVGPAANILAMFPNAESGPTPAPLVADINELMASFEVIKNQEAADKAALVVLVNETRETLRPALFTWAAAGFPSIYVLQQFTISPPSICSDGVSRGVADYIGYIVGQDMGQIIATIQALCVGVTISYSFAGNVLRIHATKT